jgi:hypothetical protein
MVYRTSIIAGTVLSLVLLLLLGAIFYKRQTVITCAKKASEALSKEINADVVSANHYYNLLYKVCMGTRGFDR